MELYKSLTRKVNFDGTSFQVKVRVKYRWETSERLEDCFSGIPSDLDKMYEKIAVGKGMFITLLVESELSGMVGSDCLGTVWIDHTYTIEDCIKENHMIRNATRDLLRQMEQAYNSIKAVLA